MSDSSGKTRLSEAAWQPLVAGPKSSPTGPSTGAAFEAVGQTASSAPTFQGLVPSASVPATDDGFSPLFGGSAAASAETPARQGQTEMLAALKQEAFEKGYAAGQAQGLEQALAQAQAKLDHFSQIIEQIETLWQQLVQSHEQQILQLICRVAQKVVVGQVAIDQDTVRRTIMQVFEQMPEPAHVAIEVNPEDFEFIEEVKEGFFKRIRKLKQVAVAVNPAIGPGGCKIRTSSGEIDASIEARLSAISHSIMEAAALKAQSQAGQDGTPAPKAEQTS